MPDLETTINTAAGQPKRVRGDEGEMEAHNLKDLIEADKYLASKTAGATRRLGIRFRQLQPPGTA